MVFFDEHYLSTSNIAVLRGAQGTFGFASIMPMYDQGERVSVDLMRFKPGSPSGTMDFIFLSLFEWAKSEGYRVFNMGMSPLSNVGQSRYSFLSEKNSCANLSTWTAFFIILKD
ncbi:phosphatidylglycerol lysyltransferase domain-containing protein [Lysinibacillus sp. MHQ-1]|nr:phosphatidylglycerol lysyltransferase domain-containing protein [Lysinibacillus sp. MHQ-1]